MKILSNLGGVQEANWDESEIQAALLDKLVLHLEITYQNEEEVSKESNSWIEVQTDHSVDVSSVTALGVHSGSFYILLIFWTNGDDDQGWRLV